VLTLKERFERILLTIMVTVKRHTITSTRRYSTNKPTTRQYRHVALILRPGSAARRLSAVCSVGLPYAKHSVVYCCCCGLEPVNCCFKSFSLFYELKF